VSSVKELVKRWYPSVDAERPHGHGSHRALDDIRESIREMAYYRARVFVDPAAVAPMPEAQTVELAKAAETTTQSSVVVAADSID
jgi:oligoribonuclease